MTYLLAEELRAHLVEQSLVRRPSERGSAAPCWVESPTGAPTPEEAGVPTAVHLSVSGGLPSPSYGEFVDQTDVDVVIRSTELREALTLALDISAALDGQRAFQLGDLRVEQVTRWRPFSRLYGTEPAQGYTLIGSFRFMLRKTAQQPAA